MSMDIIKWADGILAKYPAIPEEDEWRGVENAVDVLAIAIEIKNLSTNLLRSNKELTRLETIRQRQVKENDKLKAENKGYKTALDKLAKLGNEPEPGNSIGNIIAQKALKSGE